MANALLEHSAILLTCIEQKSALTINFGHLLEWPLTAGFNVSLLKGHLYEPIITGSKA